MKFSFHMVVHYFLALGSFVAVLIVLKSLPLAIFSLLTGVFLDADHLADYWLANGFNLDCWRFVRETLGGGLYFIKAKKVIVPLHSWELLILFLLAAQFLGFSQAGAAFALGFVPHLLWDQRTYAKRPLMYFFIFRAFHKFNLKEICGREPKSAA